MNQTPHVVVTPPTLPATLWSPSQPARFAASQGSVLPVVGVGALDGCGARRIDPAGAGGGLYVPLPKRLQRTRGWTKPKGAVYVNRPSKWHNPFAPKIIPGWATASRQYAVDDFRRWIMQPCRVMQHDGRILSMGGSWDSLMGKKYSDRPEIVDIIAELKGKDLVCDCPLSQPCHADELLEIANAEARQQLVSA